jgi:hypothetical protein
MNIINSASFLSRKVKYITIIFTHIIMLIVHRQNIIYFAMHPDKKAHMTYIKMVVHLGKG